jgi:hypothetical protein
MRSRRLPVSIGAMAELNKIVVAIEPGDPLRGSVSDASSGERPFVGWLGLLSALQTAIGEPRRVQ